ncbi:MAG: type II toxin-antitoxin system VapC family toxin [Alphaproteobacteria bacterium]
MVRALFDTNIIIDYLNGEPQARQELQRYQTRTISIITYIEVLVGLRERDEAFESVKAYLMSLEIIHINQDISDLAIEIRQTYKLKIPDALILASAQHTQALLVTRNTKDFSADIPIIRVPYELGRSA